MTFLLALNYYVLQWFCVRLARVVDDTTDVQLGWTIIFRLPMTGWTYD
jgi:hypothetical protein